MKFHNNFYYNVEFLFLMLKKENRHFEAFFYSYRVNFLNKISKKTKLIIEVNFFNTLSLIKKILTLISCSKEPK